MFRRLCHAMSLVLTAIVLASAVAADDPKPTDKVRVLILDGHSNIWHNWRANTALFKQQLEICGRFAVSVSSHLKPGDKPGFVNDTVPFPPDLSKYDVVLNNYDDDTLPFYSRDPWPWPAEFRKALDERLKDGKIGLVIVHAANNAATTWNEYNQMIGMGWRKKEFGERLALDADGKPIRIVKGEGLDSRHGTVHSYRIAVRDADHPITKDMPREWLHAPDELYHALRGPIANVHLLATAFSDKAQQGTGEHEPIIWTVAYGKGRVFHTPMGHDQTAQRCVGFLTTLRRGTEWAATGQVTLPIPADFPTGDKTSSISMSKE